MLSNREKALREITEAQFQRDVEQLLTLHGYRWYHAPANKPVHGRIQNIKAGFPDLVAVRGKRLLFIELKRQIGRLGPDQPEWLEALSRTGAEVYLWRPSDMLDIPNIIAGPDPGVSNNGEVNPPWLR
jgi:hypothetical protein